jgi:nucleotide-binding universal stress UspA family protein
MTIVVAYTPDEHGAAALASAVEEAELRHQPLLVVNVQRSAGRDDHRSATEEQLDHVRRDLGARGVAGEVERVVGFDVGEEVLAAASRVGASLIVVGVRGRTPVGKLLLGSAGQRIILEATCPVLTVKATGQDH